MCSRLIMNHMFSRKWIGQEETINWSARSPDLTLLDFFLWDFIKDRVTSPTTAENMKNRIRRTCVEVTPEMLTCVRKCFYQRIFKCISVESHHFEQGVSRLTTSWLDTTNRSNRCLETFQCSSAMNGLCPIEHHPFEHCE